MLADTWAWLGAFDLLATLLAWLAILPVGVFLWAWQADRSPLLIGLVMVRLGVWTAVAFSGLLKERHRRRPGGAV